MTLFLIVSCSSEGVVDDAFTVTVTFNGNGAKSGSMAPQRTGRGVETRLEANEYEWPCHKFTGWNTASPYMRKWATAEALQFLRM